jgi:cytochrome c553
MMTAIGSSLARADLIVTTGMQPWETCASCHSLDGISAMARFPKLAGQSADYIAKQVRDFRDGRRRNDGGQMAAIAGDIDDENLAKSAAYFAGLTPPPPDASQPAGSEDSKRGAALYRDGDGDAGIAKCSTCHDGADSPRTGAPLLAAQHAAYLEKQLRDWRSGARNNDLNQLMPAIAAKLTDRDIAALAAFLAAQPRSRPNVGQVQ